MKSEILTILSDIRPEFNFDTDDNYIEQGMLDSFDLVSLVSALDEKFGISIDGTDVLPENFSDLNAIESLLKKYVK